MDELFITDIKTPQAGKLEPSSIQTLQEARFLGQPLLDSEVPNFGFNTASASSASAIPPIKAFRPSQQEQSLTLPPQAHSEYAYSKPATPRGNVPAITYTRTLYRKSDYSAYNKQVPNMPTIWPTDKVVSRSGLFITPPSSPAEPEPLERNFSRKFTRRQMRQCHSHLPSFEKSKTIQSESADSLSALSPPVSSSDDVDRASFSLLADLIRRSLSPPSQDEKDSSSPE